MVEDMHTYLLYSMQTAVGQMIDWTHNSMRAVRFEKLKKESKKAKELWELFKCMLVL